MKKHSLFWGVSFILLLGFIIPGKIMAQNTAPVIPAETDSNIFSIVEEMPQYPGGEKAMYDFISKNVHYPQMAIDAGIEGKVYISFIVGTDGAVRDVKVVRSIGGGCDQEALRVVKMMPKWSPGKSNGVPVNVKYTLPISFVLQ